MLALPFRRSLTVLLLAFFVQAASAQTDSLFSSTVSTGKTPWTHLDFDNDPANFQFAIVSDRSGGARPGVFEDAIKKLNWLRPEFVMSVGDLIDGASGRDSVALDQQWAEHFERIAPLEMPFFHLAGNHDVKADNAFQVAYWNEMFGTPFYAFRYKDVLFLALFTNEGFQSMHETQIAEFADVLEANADARWTMVFMHHPLWMYPHETNFEKLELLLEGRPYSVFAGHHHRYLHEERQQANYHVLATTGGGSRLLGDAFGSFDHITWVTMHDEGPIIANLRLDGILPADVSTKQTAAFADALLKSVFLESDLFVDNADAVDTGQLFLTFSNSAEVPLKVDGRFFHSHQVTLTPDRVITEVPANGVVTLAFEVDAIAPFGLASQRFIDLGLTYSLQHEEYDGLTLDRKHAIPLQVSSFDALATEKAVFVDSMQVVMNLPPEGTRLFYTLDGSRPTAEATVYNAPFYLHKNTTVKAALIDNAGRSSRIDEANFVKVDSGPGLLASFYTYDTRKGTWFALPDFAQMQPKTVQVVDTFDLESLDTQQQFFGTVYSGNIDIQEQGHYTFYLTSDDGAALYIDGQPVVVDNVKHKTRTVAGTVHLEAGQHAIAVHYFQHRKKMTLDVAYALDGEDKQSLTFDQLSIGPMHQQGRNAQ